VPSIAGGDSAAQKEKDDVRILKDYPCADNPLRREGKSYPDALVSVDRSDLPSSSARDASAAPSFCPGTHGKSLIGGDGISKALMWKMCVQTRARSGNFAGAETFPVRLADAGHEVGLFHS
jgi:hypothetical protein